MNEGDAQRMIDLKQCRQCGMPIVINTGTAYCNLCLPAMQTLGLGIEKAVNSVLLLTKADRLFLKEAHIAQF